jgi:hypothetical protein
MQQLIALPISNTATKCSTKNSTPQYFSFYFIWALPCFTCKCMKARRITAKGSEEQLLLRSSVLWQHWKLKTFMIAYRLVNIFFNVPVNYPLFYGFWIQHGGSKLLHDVCKNQSTRRHIPEDLNVHKCKKSRLYLVIIWQKVDHRNFGETHCFHDNEYSLYYIMGAIETMLLNGKYSSKSFSKLEKSLKIT